MANEDINRNKRLSGSSFINRGFFIAWLLPTISSNRPKDKDRTLTDAKRTSLSEDTKDKVSYLVRHFWGVVPQWKYSLYFSYSQSKRIYPNRHSCLNLWSQYIQFTFYFCVSEMYVGIEWPRLIILFSLSSLASFKDKETCVFFQRHPPSTGFYRTATPSPAVHSKRF